PHPTLPRSSPQLAPSRFILMLRRPPTSTPFPYTTLFRSGAYVGPPVGLAHRRLSILDLSDAAHQPMWDDGRAAALCYNGEVYNRSEEHTSELQSHLKLVCRLLLEKKKVSTIHEIIYTLVF